MGIFHCSIQIELHRRVLKPLNLRSKQARKPDRSTVLIGSEDITEGGASDIKWKWEGQVTKKKSIIIEKKE